MKVDSVILEARKLGVSVLSAAVLAALLATGCGTAERQTELAQAAEELARLRQENEEAKRLKAENRELERLRRDHQELQKLRGQEPEIARLRTENDALRQQIAGVQARASAARAAHAAQAAGASARSGVDPVTGAPLLQDGVQVADDPNVPQENDELFVDPKYLKLLLPGFDWDKLQRTEPVSVKGLLEQNGIVLTNYQQLIAMGITNYQVRRQSPPAAPQQPKQ